MENKMQNTFKDVEVGTTFKVNNIEYVKMADVKVSCCKVINAHIVGQPNQRTFFTPGTLVDTNA
jgi:hypothetical protein